MAGVPPPPKKRRLGIVKEELPPCPEDRELPLVVFANGSTLPSDSDWVLRWKRIVGEALNAIEVIVFDYPEISAEECKAASKSKVKMLFDYHWGMLEDAVLKHPGHPLILMGTSMGSRINCMIAWYDYFNITTVVCLGYPLKGNEDPSCPFESFKCSWGVSSICNRLHVVRGGDQFLQFSKEALEHYETTQEKVEREAVKEIADYVSQMICEVWKDHYDDPLYRKYSFGLNSRKVDRF